MRTLDYEAARPFARLPARQLGLWLAGLFPTALLFLAAVDNLLTGDPVDSLTRYKMYHYVSLVVVLSLIVWVVMLYRCAMRGRRLLLSIALPWVCVNIYWVYLFVDEIRSDVAGQYYQTLWWPSGSGS